MASYAEVRPLVLLTLPNSDVKTIGVYVANEEVCHLRS